METTFHALFQRRRGARTLGGRAVCHQGPQHAAEPGADRTATAGGDGGTDGIFGSQHTAHHKPLPSPWTLAEPRTGLSRLQTAAGLPTSCAPHSAPVAIVISPRRCFPPPMAPTFRPQVPALARGSVPVSTRWVPGPGRDRAHGGRVATTQCCANHVVVPHLDSLTIPGRRSRCPRVDHTDL